MPRKIHGNLLNPISRDLAHVGWGMSTDDQTATDDEASSGGARQEERASPAAKRTSTATAIHGTHGAETRGHVPPQERLKAPAEKARRR
jgi:hypothetical protein